MEDQKESGLAVRARRGLLRVVDSLIKPGTEVVKLEDINKHTVAKAIRDLLQEPSMVVKDESTKFDYFTSVAVLKKMGHAAESPEADYLKEFPKEHGAVGIWLSRLTNEEVLVRESSEEPDINNETARFYVLNHNKLDEIAQSAPE